MNFEGTDFASIRNSQKTSKFKRLENKAHTVVYCTCDYYTVLRQPKYSYYHS